MGKEELDHIERQIADWHEVLIDISKRNKARTDFKGWVIFVMGVCGSIWGGGTYLFETRMSAKESRANLEAEVRSQCRVENESIKFKLNSLDRDYARLDERIKSLERGR